MTENSVSQGPAREETLDKIITDILKLHGHPVTHNSKALARELFDAGAQSRTPTNLESRTVAQHTICAICTLDKATPLRIDWLGGYVCLRCVEEWMHSQYEKEQAGTVAPQPEPFHLRKLLHEVGIVCQCVSAEEWTVQGIRERLRKVMHEYGVATGRVELAGAAALPSTPKYPGMLRDVDVTMRIRKSLKEAGIDFAKLTWIETEGLVEAAIEPLRLEIERLRVLLRPYLESDSVAASVPAASSPTKEPQQWMRDILTELEVDGWLEGDGFPADPEAVLQIIAKHYAASSPEPNQGWITVALKLKAHKQRWANLEAVSRYAWEAELTSLVDELIALLPAPPVASQPAKEED